MRKLRVYIDTSVVGGCFDTEFEEWSLALFGMAQRDEVVLVLSNHLADELMHAPTQVKEFFTSLPDACVESVVVTREALELQARYLEAGVVGSSSADDALHVAIATVVGADVIVSWNFRHIVHFDKIRQFNAINAVEGYSSIDTRSPREVV